MAKKKSKAGQPSKFKGEYLPIIEQLCKDGAIDKDLARIFSVTEKTIGNWKKKHPKFFLTIKKGKDEADEKVKQSLFNRAMGTTYEEVTKEMKLDASTGKRELETTKIVTKHYPSEVSACIFWLINRQSADWKKNGKDPELGTATIKCVDFVFDDVTKKEEADD